MASRLLSVDLFSGAGGMSLGLRDAGFECVFASDINSHANATFKKHFDVTPLTTDFAEQTAQRIREAIGAKNDPISLVCGGPPCQGFSVQRRGQATDGRNDLVIKFAQIATDLRPAVILMENVPTLLGRRGSRYLDKVFSTFAKSGYDFDQRVLNAVDYGVPQDRRRAFVVAWDRRRVGPFQFPVRLLQPIRTVRDAIGDLPEPPDDFSEHSDYSNHIRVRISDLNRIRISHVPHGGGRADLPRHLQLRCHREDNGHRHLDVYGRLDWNKPAGTITAVFDNFTRGRFAHPQSDRCITGREGARLQGFPDWFTFVGPKKEVARQIGNAVPPPLARELGVALRNCLASKPGVNQASFAASGRIAAPKMF